MGYLDITIGPMFSGKTEKLIHTYKELFYTKKTVIAINHKLDDYQETNILFSHNHNSISCISIDNLHEAWYMETSKHFHQLQHAEYILINEAQFFNNLYDVVSDMLRYNKKIYIYGLDGDFKQEKFGEILDLIPLCDNIEKLKSPCMQCGNIAIFTYSGIDQPQIAIGVSNYETLCRQCLQKNKQTQLSLIESVD